MNDRPSIDHMIEWVEAKQWEKRQWLETHSRNWPEFDVDAKRNDLTMFGHLHDYFSEIRKRRQAA